ncbi:MAG: redoxin family protein [Isosphaeraceae bacterium]
MGARLRWPGIVMFTLIFLAAIGCSSQEEEGPMDPGVSPFYPGPAGSEKAAARPDAAGNPSSASRATATVEDRTGAGSSDAMSTEGPLRPEDVERQLRIAMRTAEKRDTAKAIIGLDRILALQPTNREALLGRAFLALTQAEKAPAAADRVAAVEQAASYMKTLRRAHEKPTQPENTIQSRIIYNEARLYADQGRYDRATAVLKEGYEAAFDPFERIEVDPMMASLRSSTEYRTMLKAIDAANLAEARSRVKNYIDTPLDIPFDFKVTGLDGKPVSKDQLKGNVVVIDIWGTWCEPCRKAIPGLIQLYRRHHRLGLEIVGLAFERDAPNAEAAGQLVKQAVQEMGIPYVCALGDESILRQIPNFHAFPTTIVLDRQGRIRMLVLDNNEGLIGALDNVVQVLAAESATPTPAKAAKPAAPAATKDAAKPATAATPKPPAATKDAAKPK